MSTNTSSSTAGDSTSTECPAAAPDFDFSDYLDVCRVCVMGNADVAGLGIIVGIFLQAALMNFCVILWWIAGPGLRGLGHDFRRLWDAGCFLMCNRRILLDNLKADFEQFGATVRAVDGSSRFGHEGLSDAHRDFRKKLQKLFKSWSDVQAVTGMALLFAAILQNNGGDLSLYHTAIVLDLIAVAADGQAIMLFYAFKTDTTTDVPVEPQAPIQEPTDIVRSPSEKTTPTTRERLLNIDHGIWPRLVSSFTYLVLDFFFSFKAFFRYRDSDECFLTTKPRTGNYGTWGIAGATLVLCVYVPIFIPQDFLSVFAESLGQMIKRKLLFLYPAPPAAGHVPANAHGIAVFLSRWTKLIIAGIVWIIGRLVEWILKREIAFPLGTLAYFLWNVVDIVLLKNANQVLLVGGGDEEKSFAAFGQIVPIVMVFAIAYPICDVMQEKRILGR